MPLTASSGHRRLAVLGAPISHSRSPGLHAAAYGVLGLDWSYEALEVTGDALPGFVAGLDETWRGLSLTMPLKRDILPLLDERDALVSLTGGANTVLLEGGLLRGFNTDVYGIRRAFESAGVDGVEKALILGSGATAASALVALVELGARQVTVLARDPRKADSLEALGATLGVEVLLRGFELSGLEPDAIISTLPGHAEHSLAFSDDVMAKAVLLDVAYDPWPSAFANAWATVGGTVISGLDMLLHQALAQVRIFVGGEPAIELDEEPAVLAAMRASLES